MTADIFTSLPALYDKAKIGLLGSAYERPVGVVIVLGDAVEDTGCAFCIVIVVSAQARAEDRGQPLNEAEDSGNVDEQSGLSMQCCIAAAYNGKLVLNSKSRKKRVRHSFDMCGKSFSILHRQKLQSGTHIDCGILHRTPIFMEKKAR